MPEFKHGTLAGSKVHCCKCALCRTAARDYDRDRRRKIAYGQWPAYIDAEPVRQHVRALQDADLGWMRIARLAGLSTSTVWKLLYGDASRNLGPSKRVRRSTAEKLFAVQADLSVLGDASTVTAAGTHRRLQALVAIGWTQTDLANRLGMLRSNFGCMMRKERVQVRTAKAVRALYEELWDTPPVWTSARQITDARKAREFAAARGWVPPMGLDDDTIDDPTATPGDMGTVPGYLRKLPEDDELLWLVRLGETDAALAMRFDASEKTVKDARLRAERKVRKAVAACP